MPNALSNYLATLKEIRLNGGYSEEEGFINLPYDEENVRTVLEAAQEIIPESLKYLIVIGIGGSSLGSKAIYEALRSSRDLVDTCFLDQIEPEKIDEAASKALEHSPHEVAIVFISKSGSTLETKTNRYLLANEIDLESGFHLFNISSNESLGSLPGTFLEIPPTIGGRFSIFSPVGLLPLHLAGLDIIPFLQGGMRASSEVTSVEGHKILGEVEEIYRLYKEGKTIYNIFIFNRHLRALAEWYRQLIGESLGKEGKGLLPIVSQGSKDLHSLQQYYVGGIPNVQHEFLNIKKANPFQEGLMNATKEIYVQEEIPFRSYELESLAEEELGNYVQIKMIEILLLAQLMQVNPFGQPDVEGYKKLAKDNLASAYS